MSESILLRSGISVQIRRTDGRQHPAVVSNINYDTKSVLVEWPENGETRGKEIDFETLFSLNQYLAPTAPLNEADMSKIVRNPSRSSMNLRLPIPRANYRARNAQGPSNGTAERIANVPVRGTENIPTYQQQVSNNNRNNNVNDVPNNTYLQHNLTVSNIPAQNNVGAAGDRKARRSKVVNEVEKLKKDREERRQKHAEAREEKEAMMNIDPGNPNWQFLKMIREYQATLDFRTLSLADPVESHQITVCVRKRPLNRKEINKKEIDVISIPRKDMIVVHEPKNKVDLTKYLENQQFRFDYAFDETCSNEMVYHFTAKPLVKNVFEGGMATCFAYGQTGSGKTHTMGGTFTGKQQDCNQGIYAMVAKDVFKFLNQAPYKNQRLIVTSSFFEIYSGKVFDLLADKAKLRVLEDGKQQVQVVGLTEKVVSSVPEVLALITAGNNARTSGQTKANSNSSRSHAVFQLTLRTAAHVVHGKFSLIDLAGNERGADTMSSDRLTRMEGAEINKSLLALKECIRALGRKGAHLPFRVSKLTQVLRDSFIGDNSRTCMIAMISPGFNSCEHSLNTLRYADRVKELAAHDPMEESSESQPEEDNAETSGNAIAALRCLNEGDISTEMFNFHAALSDLQEREDDMLEALRFWIDGRAEEDNLVAITRNVDYDQEEFAARLDQLLGDRLEKLTILRERVKAFRCQLDEEEAMSRQMNVGPR